MNKILIADGLDKEAVDAAQGRPGLRGHRRQDRHEARPSSSPPSPASRRGRPERHARSRGRSSRRAQDLKVLVRAGIGLDNIDRDAAKEKGIVVANTPAATSISVAEHTFGLMLGRRPQPRQGRPLDEGAQVGQEGARGHRALRKDPGHHRLRPDRPRGRQAGPRLRHDGPRLRRHPDQDATSPSSRSPSTSSWPRPTSSPSTSPSRPSPSSAKPSSPR